MALNEFGVIGLGVMGSNLSQNLLDHDVKLSVYDKNKETTQSFEKNYGGKGYDNEKDFVDSLSKPRKIILMVTAGEIVESVINSLIPLLDENDIVIDGGNSHYIDTVRRYDRLKNLGIKFIGMGISGGAEGARYGASLMPSGESRAVQEVMPYLKLIAATTKNNDSCVEYIGDSGSGHFIKMVHNGIEYADIQIICDAYAIMKYSNKMSNLEISNTFEKWNQGPLSSFLMEISINILRTKDELTEGDLIDKISDKAGSKGTGKWTVQYAVEEGLPCGTLFSAVDVRNLSLTKDKSSTEVNVDKKFIDVDEIEKAVYASKLIAYMQGFSLMEHASCQYQWNMDFESISKIWGAGCIIQGRLINDIYDLFKSKDFDSLMESYKLQNILMDSLDSWKYVVAISAENLSHIPLITTALSDYVGYITPKLSTNLLQAMRDNFGGHTYTRDDREGIYHTEWK